MSSILSDKEIQNLLEALRQVETEENSTKQENEEIGEDENFSDFLEVFQGIGSVTSKNDLESILNALNEPS